MSEPAYLTVEAGLLDAKHREAMGEAIWTFLLIAHWQTGADGSVSGGKPVDTRQIAARLGLTDRAIRRHLDTLERAGYIGRKRSRHGVVLWIAKPKKRLPKADRNVRSGNPTADVSVRCETARTDVLVRQNGRSCPTTPYKETRKTEGHAPETGAPRFGERPGPILTPYSVCELIAEAGGLDFGKPPKKDLGNAKRLLADYPELTADDVRGVVCHLLAVDPHFWNRKTPIDPVAIGKHLPLWRKAQTEARPESAYWTGFDEDVA